jgi:hypothetical protein
MTTDQPCLQGKARFLVDIGGGRLGCVHARIVNVLLWLSPVIVCAWKEDSLIGRARLRASDTDVGAGWIELGSKHVTDKIIKVRSSENCSCGFKE